MASRLTEAQRLALIAIRTINDDAGELAHVARLPCNRGMLERLERGGLVVSKKPFAFTYHSVIITPAGRAALEKRDE